MVVFCNSEDCRFRLGHVPEGCGYKLLLIDKEELRNLPLGFDAYCAQEPNQSVSHQGNAAALGSAVEKGNLGSAPFKCGDIFHGGLPCLVANRVLEVFLAGDLSMSLAVDQNFVLPANV